MGRICIWLTGLSGADKSATAAATAKRFALIGRSTTVIDGDAIRQTISADLSFSPADRDSNVLRAALLARDAIERGDIALCALVSPYAAARAQAREIIGAYRFIEVFVNTPLAVCEARDPKGLYALARRGELRDFTGIDAPYEAPRSPDLVLTEPCDVEDKARRIVELVSSAVMIFQSTQQV
jgi:adenylyl-sulfate kinase